MAVVTISQTWADGSQLCVQVGSNNHAGYPDELNQFRHEAVAAFKELVVEGLDDDEDDDD